MSDWKPGVPLKVGEKIMIDGKLHVAVDAGPKKMTKARLRDARDIRLVQEIHETAEKFITAVHEAEARGLDVRMWFGGAIEPILTVKVLRDFVKKSKLISERKWFIR